MYTHQTIPSQNPHVNKVRSRQEIATLFKETAEALKWHPNVKLQLKGSRMETLTDLWLQHDSEENYVVLRHFDYKYAEVRNEYEEYLANKPIEIEPLTKEEVIGFGVGVGLVAALAGGLIAWDSYDAKKRSQKR